MTWFRSLRLYRMAPVVVVERDSSTVEMESVRDPQLANVTLSLWNQTVLQRMTRKEVRGEGGETYYRIDSALPVIEFCPCRFTTWNGSEALLQGRCYASFDQPSERMTAWFGDLEKWAKKNLEKGPCRTIGGFIGRSARAWFEAGGFSCPCFSRPLQNRG
jgi:hypothetical protein